MTTAVIYIPSAAAIEALARCLEHCEARDHSTFGTVVADWPAVEKLLDQGHADLVVVDSRADLPAGPRYEFVSDYQGRLARPRSRERAQLIRRDAAG